MRLEYKFLVDIKNYESLISRLTPYLSADNFYSPENNYTVRSIYFDTSGLKYYHEKLEGVSVRKKLRVRGYNNKSGNSIVFLEIKRKYENYIDKDRSPLMYYDLNDLLTTGNIEGYVLQENGYTTAQEDAEKFLHHVFNKGLKPVVLVVYDREAYYSKFDSSLRITFDKNLRYLMRPSLNKLYSERDLKKVLERKFIFEIKFNKGYPGWLKKIITDFDISRMALSKYTICLDREKMHHSPVRRKFISRTNSLSFQYDYTDDIE